MWVWGGGMEISEHMKLYPKIINKFNIIKKTEKEIGVSSDDLGK